MAGVPKLVRINAADTTAVGVREVRSLLTAEQVAEITGLSVETLAQWRSQRRGIPYIKISRNCVRYRESDLDRWLSARIVRVESDPDPSIARR